MCNPQGWLPRKALDRPKLGLALSGGGLRGLAHIGVLQSLEEHGIKIDYIAGVSMGAIVGSLYSSGYTPDELSQIAVTTDWGNILFEKPSRRSLFLTQKRTYGRHLFQLRFKDGRPYLPQAITTGQKMSALLTGLLINAPYHPNPGFDNLKIPFRAIATDLNSGKSIVFDSGDIASAVHASSTFPLVFAPVEIDGMSLIDGGMLDNIPETAAREMGADVVISVDVSSPLISDVSEPWEIVNQITTIMIVDEMEKSRAASDFVLTPVPDSISSYDFDELKNLPEFGKASADSIIEDLKAKLNVEVNEDSGRFVIESIRYTSDKWLEIDETNQLKSGDSINVNNLRRYLSTLYDKYELMDISAELNGGDIIINYSRAPLYRHIVIRGNKTIPDSIILKEIHSQRWAPLTYQNGVEDRERIIRKYREFGYSLAKIEKAVLQNDTLFIRIDEGIIDELTVKGGRYSKLNDLGLTEGTIFETEKAFKGINKLYGSDLYESVRIFVEENDSNKVELNLARKPFPLFRVGERYDLERGWKVFGEFLTADILGSGTDILLSAAPGSKDTNYRMEIGSDRLLSTYLSFKTGLFHTKHKYKLYNNDHHEIGEYVYERNFALFRVGQLISRWGLLSAEGRIENSISSHPNEGEHNPQSFSIILQSEIDTYDRYPFPKTGANARITFQSTSDFGSSGEIETPGLSYSKIYGDFQSWTPLAKRYHLYLRFRSGYAEQNVSTWEKFSLGGMDNFAGLHVREKLGNRIIAGSAGLRFDLLSRFMADAFLTARYDIGQITDGAELLEFERGVFRQGASLALALNTLLGPIEIAWGYSAPHKDIPANHLVYFSAGHQF